MKTNITLRISKVVIGEKDIGGRGGIGTGSYFAPFVRREEVKLKAARRSACLCESLAYIYNRTFVLLSQEGKFRNQMIGDWK